MRRRLLGSLTLPVVLLGVVVLAAACGGSSKATPASNGPTTTVHVAEPAAANPSQSAKMVCETDGINAIYESATGVKTISAPRPSWDRANHLFTCVYPYANGAQMTLTVKEMSSKAETDQYFDMLASTLDKTQSLEGIGQGAFQVKNGSVVVRKDYKVMLVDITKLPAQFGVPADSRGNVAINVGVAILGCWTGA